MISVSHCVHRRSPVRSWIEPFTIFVLLDLLKNSYHTARWHWHDLYCGLPVGHKFPHVFVVSFRAILQRSSRSDFLTRSYHWSSSSWPPFYLTVASSIFSCSTSGSWSSPPVLSDFMRSWQNSLFEPLVSIDPKSQQPPTPLQKNFWNINGISKPAANKFGLGGLTWIPLQT